MSGQPTRLTDIVFPGAVNHHGTLFGGAALSHMDKVAFIAASRHGRRPFVTASCERIDFSAPARQGELVEAEGYVVRAGRRSLTVEVALHAEGLLTGEQRLCSRGLFHMVALRGSGDDSELPPAAAAADRDDGGIRMVEMVFPDRTNHYGTLFGGEALSMISKAAFVAATRRVRRVVVMAASQRIDFTEPVAKGDIVELIPRVVRLGTRSLEVEVEFWAERLLTGERRRSAVGQFVMVAVKEGAACAAGPLRQSESLPEL